eukprot:CAMPEP_0119010684 /NCGR_PEP_ID=MMETSP1176-20130426/5171_1 /TAXON_ID=265551 /ORGANISM="Synedropsis recta cf, Strain CCMP1620" /LENGTH=192 /DNA_ID=CAMNT_0006963391 /DNA_START=58 /DNA_END=636 /DNA_ORIENTATION=-
MKLSICLSLALLSATSAFVVQPQQPQHQARFSPLEATKNGRWGPMVSGAVVGWALATSIATAAVMPETSIQPVIFSTQTSDYPTTLLSLGAYQPESGYDSLDFSMPTYKIEEISAAKEEPLVDSADPVKNEARDARVQANAKSGAEKEQAKAKAFAAKQQTKANAKAESEAIKARVAAGRQATRDAKLAAKQ